MVIASRRSKCSAMDLQLKNKLFVVGGASSGLGRGVAEALLTEGARVLAIARSADQLQQMQAEWGDALIPYPADLTREAAIAELLVFLQGQEVAGLLVNAGGPPAMPATETKLTDWDEAYRTVVRWKIQLIQGLLPAWRARGEGRFILVESASVKQPVANLVLSNAMRMAVVGFVKTLSQEVAADGITLNILAPSFHDTPRVQSLVKNNSERQGTSEAQTRAQMLAQVPVGFMGGAGDFGRLAAWLFSPYSRFLTGQTISVDGGAIKGAFG